MPAPRRIVIDPQIYDWLNLGGVAMAQGLVARLRRRWPEVELSILTEAPDRLARAIPDAAPLPHAHLRRWTSDRYLFGALYRALPDRIATRVIRTQRRLEHRYPALGHAATRARMTISPPERADYEAFVRAVRAADLVIVSGSSGPADDFPSTLRATLAVVDMARAHGVPTMMVSQGAGGMKSREGVARLGQSLRGVSRVLLRERVAAPARFASWGVPPSRIAFGADDGIPAAYAGAPASIGEGVGLNLRLAGYTALDERMLERTRSTLAPLLAARRAPPVPLPIALHERSPDHDAIRALLAGIDDGSDGGAGLQDPAGVIAAAARCRVVVTGAYHAAVFALSQGVPVVAVAGSELYVDKFRGLEAEFGAGCAIVRADLPEYEERLRDAFARQWRAAVDLRPGLLRAARELVRLGDAAYDALFTMVEDGTLVGDAIVGAGA